VSHPVNQAVTDDRELANCRIVELGYTPPSFGKHVEGGRHPLNTKGKRGRITWRVSRNVFDSIDETCEGGFRPLYFVSHFASRRCTSA